MRLYLVIGSLLIMGLSAKAQGIAADSGKQPVKIQAVRVKGSRLPEKSILHLTGLQTGQILNEEKLRTALQHANDSGLFTNIAYVYESAPDSTDVTLELQIADQLPLVPATIKIPKIDAELVWQYLQNFDPLFTRELPPTEKAIKLYQHYIAKYLETQGTTDIAVTGNVIGSSEHIKGIEFVATKLRSLRN
jgi:hypothetical protein